MSKSRFFRVAVAGATASDGRVIEPEWLKDAAETYKPETYTARVNVEHIRGFTGDKPFKAMGDVVALKTETIDLTIGGKVEKRLALFAQIEPHDDLVKLTKDGQKVFTSIEVAPNFGASGKAGLVGLAVTDSPASLGTERLAFTAGATAAAMKPIVDAFKTDPANLLGESVETTIELEADASTGDPVNSFFDQLKARLFSGAGAETAKPAVPEPKTPETFAAGDDKVVALLTALKADMDRGLADVRNAFSGELNTLKGQLASVQGKLDTTPASFTQRPASTGGGGLELTDC